MNNLIDTLLFAQKDASWETRLLEFIQSSDYINKIINDPKSLSLLTLLSTFIIAAIFGLIANSKKVRQPVILGYILAGVFTVILGNWIESITGHHNSETYNIIIGSLNSLSEIGVALLLFSMGLEFSRKDIKPIWGVAVFGSLAQVLFTFLLVSGIMYCLRGYIPELQLIPGGYFLIGACFVSTSTAVVVKCLSAKGHDKALSGRIMIGVSIVQDLTVIPLLLLVSQLANIGKGQVSIGSFIPLVGSIAFMVLMIVLGGRFFPIILQRVARQESKELFVLAVTLIALISGAIAEAMQVSFSFGAFLAGIAISESEYGKKALSELIAVRDLFALLFFVSIGAMLDFSYLKQHYVLVLVVMLLTSLSRTVFLSIVTWVAKYRNVIPVAMLFGMFPTSEIAFVGLAFCQENCGLPNSCYSLVLCAVICSMIVGPLVNELTTPVYNLLRRTLLKNQQNNNIILPHPDLDGHVIFISGAIVIDHIDYLLNYKGISVPFVMVESLYDQYAILRKRGNVNAIYGDPLKEQILKAAGIDRANVIVIGNLPHQDKLRLIELARSMNPQIRIIAFAASKDDESDLRTLKTNDIILSLFETILEALRRILRSKNIPADSIQSAMEKMRRNRYMEMTKTISLNPEASESTDSVSNMQNLIELNWFKVSTKSPFIGRSIADSGIRSKTGVSIVGIIRNGKMIPNPGPSENLMHGDMIATIGTPEQMQAFEQLAATPNP